MSVAAKYILGVSTKGFEKQAKCLHLDIETNKKSFHLCTLLLSLAMIAGLADLTG